ncbi:hypothetical protein KI809_17725 [Geobacter pelophilus]|uniref:Uncharacterized protein n=1 Tax=Geoanaerobacter pelophilus TaxID=60036 RepID=A0AAW4L4M3_9BACT|nr:hypothetical protein [Geoanaerobacter pelophilus]
MTIRIFFWLFWLLLIQAAPASAKTIHISVAAPASLLSQPACRLAVTDTVNLLRKAFPAAIVNCNAQGADIRLVVPSVPANAKAPGQAAYDAGRDESFRWTSNRRGATTILQLTAASPVAVANGLYGLLQEKLGISFIHPRQTLIPVHSSWPLPSSFTFYGQPEFPSRGFHLHTLHPIELTEQLHDPTIPNSFEDIREYLDWLARNGQNRFQFFLLRGIDRDRWIPHARRIVDYAHQRGISCGVEISLAMLQQQAFQAITLLRPFPSYRRQVDRTLDWLFQAQWDFISLEATMGEHLPFLGRFLPGVQSYFEQQVSQRYQAKLMYATHVICQDNGEKVRRPNLPGSGILIHTVMCYSAVEPKAPVYGNDNQRFMLEAAQSEAKRRETWYWPESSYWVGFDSSVPLLLLPYLSSRWEDINQMRKSGVHGHLTFTSGWEWGYWLVDWSISRWSWRYGDDRKEWDTSPVSRLVRLFPDRELTKLWQEALRLQNYYLKERELLRYLSALTPFSELPDPLNRPFQPDPGFRYSWLLNDASPEQAEAVRQGPVTDLEQYADRMQKVTDRLDARFAQLRRNKEIGADLLPLATELTAGLRVSALRASHRALTLRALLAQREEAVLPPGAIRESDYFLALAQGVRRDALFLVRRQEARYRYPVAQLAQRRKSLTAYPFGYLYPVTNLYFWDREEQQVRQERFDPLFMNLWDIRRTLGLRSLLFR